MLKAISRRNLVKRFKKLGFDGPYSGGRHLFMAKKNLRVRIPNPHGKDISAFLVAVNPGKTKCFIINENGEEELTMESTVLKKAFSRSEIEGDSIKGYFKLGWSDVNRANGFSTGDFKYPFNLEVKKR